MKLLYSAPLVLVVAMSSATYAHDPKLHAKGEDPKCEKLKNMDSQKLNSGDPIMLALRKRCAEYMNGHMNEGDMGEHSNMDGHMHGHGKNHHKEMSE